MTLPGETLATGAPKTCKRCKVTVEPAVQVSGGGYYIGTWCDCGPYTRESGYYATEKEAQQALDNDWYCRA